MKSPGVLVGLLALVLLPGCTDNGKKDTRPTPTISVTRSPATADVSAQNALSAWQLLGAFSATGHRVNMPGTLEVGKDVGGARRPVMRQIALVFPAPTGPARCIEQAQLQIAVRAVQGEDAEIAVYPADQARLLRTATSADRSTDLGRLIDNHPRGYVAVAREGPLRIDITALYRTWARGGPFPSQEVYLARRHTPFGVVLRPESANEGHWNVKITSGSSQPQLTVRRLRGCA